MMHPATAPTLPCPAIWPAMPPTIAPLMHPFASAAGANAITRIAVQRISSFIAVLRKTDAAPIRIVTIGSQMAHDIPPTPSPCRPPSAWPESWSERCSAADDLGSQAGPPRAEAVLIEAELPVRPLLRSISPAGVIQPSRLRQ